MGIEHAQDNSIGRCVIVRCPMEDMLCNVNECENNDGVNAYFPSDGTWTLVASYGENEFEQYVENDDGIDIPGVAWPMLKVGNKCVESQIALAQIFYLNEDAGDDECWEQFCDTFGEESM